MNFNKIINKIIKRIKEEQGENIVVITRLEFSERVVLNRIKEAVRKSIIDRNLGYMRHNRALALDQLIIDALNKSLKELDTTNV